MKKKSIWRKRGMAVLLSCAMAFTSVNLPIMATTVQAATLYGDNYSLSELARDTNLKVYKLDGTEKEITQSGIYYVEENADLEYKGENSTSSSKAGGNGLKIADGVTAYIYIPGTSSITATGGRGYDAGNASQSTAPEMKEGKSVLYGITRYVPDKGVITQGVSGTPGTGATGGGAAIYVPSSSKLIAFGEGKLNATGGAGGNAGLGANGSTTLYWYGTYYAAASSSPGDISYYNNIGTRFKPTGTNTYKKNSQATTRTYYNQFFAGGAGGSGGGGASGGGAGIGTNGANGSEGLQGGNPTYKSQFANLGRGNRGAVNNSSSSSGTIYIQCEYSAHGGIGGTANTIVKNSSSGSDWSGTYHYNSKNTGTIKLTWTNGQAGGNGGAGASGAGVGTGGQGGAGGNGGDSGDSGDDLDAKRVAVQGEVGANGTSGTTQTEVTPSSLGETQYPYNTVTFTDAKDNRTQQYYLTKGNTITVPEYDSSKLASNELFTEWKVTTAATGLPSVFKETKSSLATNGKTYKAGEEISATGIYGNVVLTAQKVRHTHSWNYKVDDNDESKILAYCAGTTNASACPYHGEEKAAEAGLYVALSAEDAEYTGSPYTGISVDDQITRITGASASDISYTGRGDTTYDKSEAPTEAGTYTAEVSIGDVTAKKDFEITKASQSGLTVRTANYVYDTVVSTPETDGEVQENAACEFFYSKTESKADAKKWSELTATTLEPDTYYIFAKYAATKNYNEYTTPATAFRVTENTTGNEKVTITDGTYTYDGKGHGIIVTTSLDGATITYGESEENCDLTESPKKVNASEDPYTIYYKVSAPGYREVTGSAEIAINRADVEITPSADQSKVYGETDPSYTFTAKGLAEGEEASVLGVTLKREDGEDAGDYAYAVERAETTNYNVTLAEESPKFTITPKPVTLSWSEAELTYNGKMQAVTAEVTNAVGQDRVSVTYEKDSNEESAVGSYTAKVAGLDNKNYTLDGAKETSRTWSISYLNAKDGVVTGSKNDPDNAWYVGTVTVKPDEDTAMISEDGVNWSSELTRSTDGAHSITYYLKNADGFISDQKTVSVQIDTTAPSGTITVQDNAFKELLTNISFGYFFKETVDVKITGDDTVDGVDPVSGISRIEYQKVSDPADYDENGAWTSGDKLSVAPNEKFVVYARITDRAGNYTVLCSDGTVVYTDATSERHLTYTKKSEDLKSGIELHENAIRSVVMTDEAGQTRDIDSANYTVIDDQLILRKEFLDELDGSMYTFDISYDPYGTPFGEGAVGEAPHVSRVELEIKKADGALAILTDLTKDYDSQAVGTVEYRADSTGEAKVLYRADGETEFTDVRPVDAGSYEVKVTVAGDRYYHAAEETRAFAIHKIAPQITVNDTWEKEHSAAPFNIDAKTDSDAPLRYKSSNEAVAAVDENGEVTINGIGTAVITVSLPEGRNYTEGTKDVTVTVQLGTLVEPKVSLTALDPMVYDGTEQKPEIVLQDGKIEIPKEAYSVRYENNVNAGTGSVIVTIGEEEVKGEFTILPKDIKEAVVTLDGTLIYDGTEQTQLIKSVVVDGQEVTYEVSGNTATKAGEHTMTITGTGNYTGTMEQKFTIQRNPGTVTFEVKADEAIPETTIGNSKEDMIAMLADDKEQEAIEAGDSLNIWVEITDASETVTEDAKELIKEKAADYDVGAYIDISLFKKLATAKQATQITGTNKMISVAIVIPETLRADENAKRDYVVVRVHEGKAEILPTVREGDTLTFMTDKFSDYAIMYHDQKVEEPVVEDPKKEEPVVEEPKKDEPAVEEPVVEEPKKDEPVVEEPKKEEPVVEEPKKDEPVVEDPKKDEPVVEDPKKDKPAVEEPTTEDPKKEEPVVEDPKKDEPAVEEPTTEEPKKDEPVVEDPKKDEPVVEDPKKDEPVVEEPKKDEPVVEDPKKDEPVVEDPKKDEPVVEDPKKDEPVVEDPKKDEPVVEDPTKGKDEPVVEDPKKGEPVVEDPTKDKPVVEDPSKDQPTTEDPKKDPGKSGSDNQSGSNKKSGSDKKKGGLSYFTNRKGNGSSGAGSTKVSSSAKVTGSTKAAGSTTAKAPRTGDVDLLQWWVLMLLGLTAIVGSIIYRKKRNRTR